MSKQNTTALARELVSVLVHLKEAPTGVPENGQEGYNKIRAEYATAQSGERGPDPLLSSAEAWTKAKLDEAFGKTEEPEPEAKGHKKGDK